MTVLPRKIRRTDSGVEIEWSDEHRSRYSFAELRRNCPCAECRRNPPKVVEANDPLRLWDDLPIGLDDMELVGHYAVQFNWNDGHRHGIYAFSYLRELCPCDACRELGRHERASNPA